ncbi:MAG: pentapeptide repeat-containing protein [Paracoccaceae bacterium]
MAKLRLKPRPDDVPTFNKKPNNRGTIWTYALGFVKLSSVITALVIGIHELRAAQNARIQEAWQVVSTPAPGRSGKRQALEYLNSEAFCVSLPTRIFEKLLKNLFEPVEVDVDLSSRWWFQENERERIESPTRWCWKDRSSLNSLELSPEIQGGVVDLRGIDLSNADLSRSNLSGVLLSDSNLSGAYMELVNLEGAYLHGSNLENATVFASNLSKARFSGDFDNLSIAASNLDDAVIELIAVDKIYIWNSSVNNTLISVDENSFYIEDNEENEVLVFGFGYDLPGPCENIHFYNWALMDALPQVDLECLRDGVSIYDPEENPINVLNAYRPYEQQLRWKAKYGRTDPLISMHLGPEAYNDKLLPQVTNPETISTLWLEQSTQK